MAQDLKNTPVYWHMPESTYNCAASLPPKLLINYGRVHHIYIFIKGLYKCKNGWVSCIWCSVEWKTFFDLVFVCLATETRSHDSVLLIRAGVGDPRDGVGNSLLPPRNGKEELVLHSDPNAPHHSFAGNVVHETQVVAHVDPARRKVRTSLR